ncbi:MAG: hypothetical protein RLZZ301_352 [Bacteroidota bacterium]|jgi:hypothetical protein
MRFRLLTTAELAALETEFTQFLVVNGLYDLEWRKLAQEDPEKANQFVALFSDIVLEKVYSKIPGLLQIGHDFIALFIFEEANWTFYQFQAPASVKLPEIDLENYQEILKQYQADWLITKGSKRAPEAPADQIFSMVKNGAFELHTPQILDFLSFLSEAH